MAGRVYSRPEPLRCQLMMHREAHIVAQTGSVGHRTRSRMLGHQKTPVQNAQILVLIGALWLLLSITKTEL